MTPQDYCAKKAAEAGSSFTAAFRLLPLDRRQAMEALYAFCREVDDVVDECSDPALAEVKLHWWRQELDQIAAGKSQHPLGQALHPCIGRYGLNMADLHAVVDGMEMDLTTGAYADFAGLDVYCDRVAGAVGRLSARIFGTVSDQTLAYATELGLALQYTNILRDVGDDARKGRVYLPEALLAAHGSSGESVLGLQASDRLTRALADMAQKTHARYDKALDLLPRSERVAQRPGLVMAAVYRDLLRTLEASDFAVLHQRISLTPARKLWVAWWAAAGRMPR
ncbi:MAG: presqualene diphosphate synthase HpnD [Burkholderiaceae bacterium]